MFLRGRNPRRTLACVAAILAAALWAGQADAAAIMAIASRDTIAIGESTMITLTLNLKEGEVASGYLARFDVIGEGSVVDEIGPLSLVIGGPPWDSQSGPDFDDPRYDFGFELASEQNEGGTRLVAMLTLTGRSPGTVRLLMGPGSQGIQQIDAVPFEDEVWLDPLAGTTLLSVVVVPEPTTLLLVSAGLGALALRRRRRR
jgi:hypothetical protein